MVQTRIRLCGFGVLCWLAWPSAAHGQAAGQIWGNLAVDWLTSERRTYELTFETKAQPTEQDGQPGSITFDTTPRVEHTLASWIDVLAETEVARTNQVDAADTVMVTPRIGVELHIFSRILGAHGASRGGDREKHPRRRLVVASLVRLENERTFYSNDDPTKSSWQLRDRFGVTYPLNRAKATVDGAIYLTSDGEMFMPFDQDEKGHLVNELRLRAGIGYRRSFAWRFETLGVWNGKRNDSGVLAPQYHAIEVLVRREF